MIRLPPLTSRHPAHMAYRPAPITFRLMADIAAAELMLAAMDASGITSQDYWKMRFALLVKIRFLERLLFSHTRFVA